MKNKIYLAGYCIIITCPVILKLTGVIAWSWWWTTAPVWVPNILIIAFFVLLRKYNKI